MSENWSYILTSGPSFVEFFYQIVRISKVTGKDIPCLDIWWHDENGDSKILKIEYLNIKEIFGNEMKIIFSSF